MGIGAALGTDGDTDVSPDLPRQVSVQTWPEEMTEESTTPHFTGMEEERCGSRTPMLVTEAAG